MKRLFLVGCTLSLMVLGFAPTAEAVQAPAARNTRPAVTSTLPTSAPEPEEGPSTEAPVQQEGIYERARIEHVEMRDVVRDLGARQMEVYRVKFLSGPLEGQEKEILNDVGSNPYGLKPQTGDVVVVFMQSNGDNTWQLFLEGFDRRATLVWLVVLFVVTLVLLSGMQGLKVALSIGISVAMIGYILIPAFVKGVNPVPLAILLSGIFTLVSTGFTTGWNKKSLVTAIGTVGGAITAYFIAHIFANWAHLEGLSTEEDRLFFSKNPLLNPQGLLFAGIIIAATGVVEDVAVSIASGVSEVKRANARISFRGLFTSGMIVGRDHMGALANTLVFAYVGGSLSTLLLYYQFGGSWLKFVNFDSVVDEVIRSLAGTIGLIFTVPITALLAAWVMQREKISLIEPAGDTHHHGHGH